MTKKSNPEVHIIWQEILHDFNSTTVLWQVGVVVSILVLALLLGKHFQRKLSVFEGGLVRGLQNVVFPLSAYLLFALAVYGLAGWMNVGILRLFMRLMMAMAIIRTTVYVLRYVFAPSLWLQSFEKMIAWGVWVMVALHISGLLDQLLTAMEEVTFSVGKQQLNLLLLLQGLMTVVVTMLLTLWVSRMIELRLMAASNINGNLRVILVKVIRMLAIVLALLVSLSAVGIDLTMLSVFGGALGVGLGFGLQKIASNYVSGFIILMDKSLHMGDIVTIHGHYGIVKELRSRYMLLRKQDGTEIIIPNEMMITDAVINHTSAAHKAKVPIPIQISYESDLDLAIKLLKDIGTAHQRTIKDDSAVDVTIKAFAESGIDLLLSLWVLNPEEATAKLQSEIYYEIWQRFKANNIQIPYPQRDVRVISAPAASVAI